MTILSTEERRLMGHALGLRLPCEKKARVAWRNYYSIDSHSAWDALCERGLARRYGSGVTGGYSVTDAGCVALIGRTLAVAERSLLTEMEVREALERWPSLHLPLKRVYFEQIASGEKTHEYRLDNAHWRKRLVGQRYDKIVLTCGYPKRGDSERTLVRKWLGEPEIQTITHPHFGPEPKRVFAIDVREVAQ